MRDGPKTTGELSRAMPSLSRFAIMQHLSVLEEAKLVLVKREGRKRFNFSNPSVLRDLYIQWVNPLADHAAEVAQHLRNYAETHSEAIQNMNQENFRHVKIELETRINAPVEVVFRAMTDDYPKWWPHKMNPEAEIFFENKLGGTFGERWPNEGGVIYGTIIMLEPGKKLMVTNVGMFGDYTATNLETVTPDGTATIHKKSLHLWGDVSDEIVKMLRDGSRQLIEDAMRAFCEAQVRGN